MSTWKTTPTSVTPRIELSRWSLWEVPLGEGFTYHLVGTNLTEGGEGRVSSNITGIDLEEMELTTNSGRVYKLIGRPGNSMDGMYVWMAWKRKYQVSGEKEIDLEYLRSKIGTQASEEN